MKILEGGIELKKIIFAILLVLLFFSPRIYWMLKPATSIDIAVVDKTVPRDDYREHNGLFWMLKNEKITRPDGELYDIGRDYFGYDPYENSPKESFDLDRTVDLIYIADTYGVYTDDLEEKADGDRSEKIYGGMDLLEWNKLMASKGEDTTLIAEYNSFATPTDAVTRGVMEDNLSVEWSGWAGRYFDDLNSAEVPAWLIDNYENQQSKKWAFEGEGIAFVHLSDQVIVLGEDDIDGKVLFQLNEEGAKKFPKAEESTYAYWFDIVTPKNDAAVLASYKLPISENGFMTLKEAGVPWTFPAIIHHPENKTYYFAGDFADYTKTNLQKWQGSPYFMSIFSNDVTNFFWSSYIPIMKDILSEIETDKGVNEDGE